MTNPFVDTATQATRQSADPQERNMLWWETKPMTYADWEKDDRLPKTEAEFREIENYVLRTGPWLKRWFERAQLTGKTCIDIGCGSGIFSSMLARRGADVTAVDLTEAAVGLARQTARVFGVDIQVTRADVEHMPFADASFDFAYSWGVLHHTSDMAKAVGEMGRVLKPGGRGMMMVYHRISVVYYLHGLFWLLVRGKLFKGYNLERVQDFYTDGFYHRYMTPGELGAMLAAAGLTVERFSVTQYEKKILPRIPVALDEWLKARFGMCLVAEFAKPA
jgi:2-polyprenyl-3-methyl-5-hydroxy-6-metoxy-1,4-benzoquinol methylase